MDFSRLSFAPAFFQASLAQLNAADSVFRTAPHLLPQYRQVLEEGKDRPETHRGEGAFETATRLLGVLRDAHVFEMETLGASRAFVPLADLTSYLDFFGRPHPAWLPSFRDRKDAPRFIKVENPAGRKDHEAFKVWWNHMLLSQDLFQPLGEVLGLYRFLFPQTNEHQFLPPELLIGALIAEGSLKVQFDAKISALEGVRDLTASVTRPFVLSPRRTKIHNLAIRSAYANACHDGYHIRRLGRFSPEIVASLAGLYDCTKGMPPSLKRRRFIRAVREVILNGPDPDSPLFASRPFHSIALEVHRFLPDPAKSSHGTRFIAAFVRRINKIFGDHPQRQDIVEAFQNIPDEVDFV
jgi:hypothetical protein